MNKNVKKMIIIALMAAMSCVLYFFPKFPIPIFPSFLEVNFSMLPIFICGFMLGEKEGFFVVLIRFLVKLLYSHTAGVGEIVDLILGGVTVIWTSFIYRRTKKNLKGLIISLITGMFIWILVGILTNYFISIPLYIELYFGGSEMPLLGMLEVLPGKVTLDNYMWKYILFAVIPFNFCISFVVCICTFFVQRRLAFILEDDEDEEKASV